MAFLDETGLNRLWQQIVAKSGSKLDKEDPTGTGSLSLNRKSDTSIGYCAVAEGYNNTATGRAAHAEGEGTTASSQATHAEGYNTTASAWYAHAEGNTTTASARAAHAEGGYTTASGQQSHAEGFQTIAASTSQHVQGKYNIEDAADTYAHIVGNGSSDGRSNAHTLDWNGNAWYKGSVKVGGTSYDDASEVALKNTPVTATSTNGIAYTVTANYITATSLSELKGVCITIIPNMTSESGGNVTLNVNGLGAKGIKRNDSLYTHDWWSFGNTDWMRAGYPVPVMFDGTYWMVMNRQKTYASDLQGTVPVNKGGTGATTADAARTNLGAAPAYTYGTSDLTAGTSSLATGTLYFVYE